MAYQHTQSLPSNDFLHRFVDGIRSFFSVISRGMIAGGSANRRLAIAERLRAKSDDELAEMGVRREDIIRHVFRDMLDV